MLTVKQIDYQNEQLEEQNGESRFKVFIQSQVIFGLTPVATRVPTIGS